MKIEKFQLCSSNSMRVGAFHLLHGRTPTQLRGNIDLHLADLVTKRAAFSHASCITVIILM
jgi:hypothetical protein